MNNRSTALVGVYENSVQPVGTGRELAAQRVNDSHAIRKYFSGLTASLMSDYGMDNIPSHIFQAYLGAFEPALSRLGVERRKTHDEVLFDSLTADATLRDLDGLDVVTWEIVAKGGMINPVVMEIHVDRNSEEWKTLFINGTSVEMSIDTDTLEADEEFVLQRGAFTGGLQGIVFKIVGNGTDLPYMPTITPGVNKYNVRLSNTSYGYLDGDIFDDTNLEVISLGKYIPEGGSIRANIQTGQSTAKIIYTAPAPDAIGYKRKFTSEYLQKARLVEAKLKVGGRSLLRTIWEHEALFKRETDKGYKYRLMYGVGGQVNEYESTTSGEKYDVQKAWGLLPQIEFGSNNVVYDVNGNLIEQIISEITPYAINSGIALSDLHVKLVGGRGLHDKFIKDARDYAVNVMNIVYQEPKEDFTKKYSSKNGLNGIEVIAENVYKLTLSTGMAISFQLLGNDNLLNTSGRKYGQYSIDEYYGYIKSITKSGDDLNPNVFYFEDRSPMYGMAVHAGATDMYSMKGHTLAREVTLIRDERMFVLCATPDAIIRLSPNIA